MNDANPEASVATEIELEKTIPLRKPVTLGKDKDPAQLTYTELKLREPTADEVDKFIIKQGSSPGLSAMYYLIATVSGVPEPAIRKIGQLDIKEAMRFLLPFVSLDDVFQKTGETSSPN